MAAIRILSVDDEEEIEFLITQFFRRKIRSGEYEFFFAHNGVEGLAALHDHPDIEIILCDINMPEMDGLEMLAKVNEMQNPALRVIMVSAYGDMENIRMAMNDGAFDFATKPIDMDDLERTIEKAIRQIDFVHQSQKEHKKLEGLEKDLAAANQIQQFILPREFPPFPDVSDKLDISASMEVAKDIGGDFYDFFRIDDDHIALVIGDVCGKGIPAALFMAVSRTFIRSVGMQYEHVGECITNVNRLLASSSVEYMFVTVFYAIYDIRTGLLTYCNGGHNPPYLLHADGTTEQLPMTQNAMVGAYKRIIFKESTLQLEQGDTLIMFTDGVTEAMNPAREMFGIKRLDGILRGQTDKSCQQMIESIKTGISGFVGDEEQSDDITMLLLKRK
ncbi:MAG: SpoIIE family protein phosphatase [Prevotella sp.]|nr:SpoIIE family protein phosphatase [Prevotella sp.]